MTREQRSLIGVPAQPAQPAQPADEEFEYDDEEDVRLFGHDEDDVEDGDHDEENEVTHGGAHGTPVVAKEKKKLFQHLKTSKEPLFLQSEPQWLQEAMEAAPIFCGLLSLCTPTRQGVEILKVADLEHSR